MQLRAENQNLVSALSNYQQILYQFFDFTQNLKQSPSDLPRTISTARFISAELGLPIQQEYRLREMNNGVV